jgi:hypothetical protein
MKQTILYKRQYQNIDRDIFWNLFESYSLEDGSKENARAKFLQVLFDKTY